jgi:ribosomal protein S18 acetylase RimI-like enzyme
MQASSDFGVTHRPARATDAPALVHLADAAGEGLPAFLWGRLAKEGQSAHDVGEERISRETGSISYRNATVLEADGAVVGMLLGYPLPSHPEPVPDDLPPLIRPLAELENEVCGTWYVNILAVAPDRRSGGLGSRLLALAEELGRKAGSTGMSVITTDSNAGALRLYRRHGYRDVASRAVVSEDWATAAKNWILLSKTF